jgi:sulfide:quinone oxidoreductase
MRTLILGAGFGGIAAAVALRERLGPDHEIVLVDRRDSFFMGLRKIWLLVGEAPLAEGIRPLDLLGARHGIRVVRAEITRLDPAARRVATDQGPLDGDRLIVALGAEPRSDLVAGMDPHAFNLYDAESVARAAPRVAALEGGRVVAVIAGVPYKCPPAPFEAVMQLDALFRRRGVRDRVELAITTLQPILLPNAGAEGSAWLAGQLDARGIGHRTGCEVEVIESGRVRFRDGSALPFDVALVTPPHRCPRVVVESGLTGDGQWVPVDRNTLATAWPGVYAIGDVTLIPLANRLPLPKAGLFAEAEGQQVAAAIAAEVLGEPEPAPFDGRGACFLEMGPGEATLIEGDFFAEPAPVVRVGTPSRATKEEKRGFEAERLARWFG